MGIFKVMLVAVIVGYCVLIYLLSKRYGTTAKPKFVELSRFPGNRQARLIWENKKKPNPLQEEFQGYGHPVIRELG